MVLYSILLALFITVAFGMPTEHDLNRCEYEGEHFGSGKGKDFISSNCYLHFSQVARATAKKESASGEWRAVGFRNMVFIERKQAGSLKRYLISGSSTELKEIIALALDEVNHEVAVLESNGDVLFFSITITGNVAPKRTLRAVELVGAEDVVVNAKTDQVILLNPKSESLFFFSRLANFFGREGMKKLGIERTIEGLKGASGLSLDFDQQKLKILGPKQEILSVDLLKPSSNQ